MNEHEQREYLQSLDLKQNQGYFILKQSATKALAFSPTAENHIVIWDRSKTGEYVNGDFRNRLNPFEIYKLKIENYVDDYTYGKILNDLQYDYKETNYEVDKDFIPFITGYMNYKFDEYDFDGYVNAWKNASSHNGVSLKDLLQFDDDELYIADLPEEHPDRRKFFSSIDEVRYTIAKQEEDERTKFYNELSPEERDELFLETYSNISRREVTVTDDISPEYNSIETSPINKSEELKLNLTNSISNLLIENSINAEIVDIRQYKPSGHTADDFINVLVEYSGDIREDDFFTLLKREDFYYDGKKLDINPITATKSGTIDEYLDKRPEIIKSITLQTYNGDSTNPRMKTLSETFNELEAFINEQQLSIKLEPLYLRKGFRNLELPDEELRFYCNTVMTPQDNYIDIRVIGYLQTQQIAQIKTLDNSADAFMAMNELAGKCQLMLNGNGREYQLTSNQPKHDFNLQLDNAQKIVYVCSPLRGEIQSNIARAREFGRFVAEQGATPIAPHVTEFFDDTVPKQREQGLNLGINYLERSDELWVFGNHISSGMAEEIRIAKENMTIPIYHVDDKSFERIPFDEWQSQREVRGSEEHDLPLHRDLSDRIKEYEEDFDLSPATTENMTIEELSAYCKELEISMQYNSFEHEYDEPFVPDISFTQRGEILYLSDGTEIDTLADKQGDYYSTNGNDYYPVITHNSITNETRMIGFDKERSYEFSIDEYNAFSSVTPSTSQNLAEKITEAILPVISTENTEMKRTKQSRTNNAPRESSYVNDAQKEMADKVDLKSYLETHGYTLKAHGREYKLVLDGHDSTVIFPDTNTWYSFSNDIGGGTIKFLTEIERKDFISAVKELIGEARDFSIIHHPNQVNDPKPRKPMILPEHDENNRRVFAYLIKTRGIDREIVEQCIENNSIYQGKNTITKGNEKFTFSNCIFVGFDENQNAKYASQRSLNDMNGAKPFKQDVFNSDKEYGFKIMGKDNAEWVSVCEAPIDVLSKATLNKLNNDVGNEHIISLGGVADKSLDKFLEINPNIKVINICLDNDEAGRNAGAKMADKYTKLGYQVVESYPTAKDYNEELIRRNKELEQKVELPVATTDSTIIVKHLTTNKMLSPTIVDDLIKNQLVYQIDRNTTNGSTMHDVVFVSKDNNGDSIYGITVNYNNNPDRADFKMEHRGTTSHNYLSHIGDSTALQVFNNPISMYTYITIQQAKNKPCDNCICCISKQSEAVQDFISIHTDIKSIKITMDKTVSNTPDGQSFDLRENTVQKISKAVGSKISVSKQYPKSNSLSQDWIKHSQSQKNPQHNNQHSASQKVDMQLEP